MDCPCGSGRPYEACCGPLIDDKQPGETPEAVMRARYTAHVVEKVDYLVESNHPETRESVDLEASRAWAKNADWLGLEVVDTAGGGSQDTGEVEFIAHYAYQGDKLQHHERAIFKREDGAWLYHDGEMVKSRPYVREEPRVGRNDPCPCGSGKKYKKCHGA